MDPNSNNPNDPNNPTPPSGFSWPSTPGGGLSQAQTSTTPTSDPTQNITASPPPPASLGETPQTPIQEVSLDIPSSSADLSSGSGFSAPSSSTIDPAPTSNSHQNFGSTPLDLNTSPTAPPLDNLTPSIPSKPAFSGTIDGAAPSVNPLTPPETTPQEPPSPIQPITPEVFAPDNSQTPSMPPNLSQSLGLGRAEQPGSTPPSPQTPTETAPTDLSHLISETPPANNHNEVYTPPIAQPDNLVVPSNNTPESITTSENHFNISKILIIVGIIVILIVSGLSAYFILGIGKPAPSPASVPAQEESTLTNPPQQIQTSPTLPSTPPATTSSNLVTPTPTPSGTSAVDLLKQRQNSSTSPTIPPGPPLPSVPPSN